ncbi:MAG: FHA domain-containing protein [Polyangiaceae bacterium]|nr:FHA domain-containing protein [Polyangiaceae bacterium]MCB9609285.1 FHA domain-containing protein [Polyangiaceae bacterium]
MIPGFGKQTITIGSAPHCEIRLGGPGVAPEHARIVHQGGGQLVFVDGGTGQTTANGQPLQPASTVPFDFRTQFVVGQATLPNAHPAIALMLLDKGQLAPTPGELTFGRDAARCHIVVHNQNVSGRHASFRLQPFSVTDHGSTSGTWLGQERLPPEQARPIDANALVAIGPVPIAASVVQQLLAGGQPAGAPAAAAGAAAGAAAAGGNSGPRKKHKTVIGQVQLGGPTGAAFKTIGRTEDNDIPINHPQISSKHALLHKIQGQLYLEDRGSANGTYVRGQRIPPGQKVPVQSGEKVFIGPMPLLIQEEAQEVAVVVEDSAQWAGRPLYEIEAWDLVIQVPDRDNPKELKTLLDHISFKAMPGDLIALMGPSGAGKTTLLLTLNGYMPPTHGQVRINGEDLYAIYDVLRGSIGYVPQDDIVHPELTVWEAVRYSAKFRLPPDFSEDEIDRRVDMTLRQLGLDSVKHLQIGKPEKKVLSGGQRKRVNIAMELVTDPIIMFLDEPTSGLAADDTTALVQLLADLAKQTGKTIITTIHQPAKDEFEKFNLTLVLGVGGIPIFYGPTKPDAYRFFGSFAERQGKPNDIDNPRDMFDMLNQREGPILQQLLARNPNASKQEARSIAAREWHKEFFSPQNPTFQKMFSGRRAVGSGSQQQLSRTRPKGRGQFGLLLSRYFKVKVRDTSGIVIMLAQAPIIGVLLAMVFGFTKDAIPYWCLGALQELGKKFGSLGGGIGDTLNNMQTTPDHSGAANFLVVSAVWFGTSNAAREIVSERAVYLRERMVNLGLFNYVFSKFFLLSMFCVIQCTVLLAIVFFSLGFNGGPQAFVIDLGILVAVSMNSVALGLLLSTMVESAEAAMALTPIALIPQVVLAGLMVPMTTNPYLKWPMYIVPARWGFEGVVAQERLAIASDPAWIIDIKKPDASSVPDFLVAGKFHCAKAQIASSSFNGAWGFENWELTWLPPVVLTVMMFSILMVVLVILKRRDSV